MRRVLLIIGLMLLLGACGGDSDDGGDVFGLDDSAGTDDSSAAADDGADEPADGTDDTDQGDPAPVGVDRSAELVGTWNVTFYALPDGGGRTNVIGGEAPVQITFSADGTISYHTGCNAGGTTYATDGVYVVPESALDDTPEGQPITIDQGAQEEQGCEGFLGEQDVDLPAAWQQAERFRLDEDRLVLSAEFFLVEAERG